MAKTANGYVADQPGITVTVDATNVTDHAAFTDAFTAQCNIVNKDARPTRPPRPAIATQVAGSADPIVTRSTRVNDKVMYELSMVDDYFLGATGEITMGVGSITVWEIFNAFFDSGKIMGGFHVAPAGEVSGRNKIVFTNPVVEHCGFPSNNADQQQLATFPVTIAAENATVAAIA